MSTVTAYDAEERDLDAVAEEMAQIWSRNLETIGEGVPAKVDWFYRSSPTGPGRVVMLRSSCDGLVGCQGIGVRRVLLGDRALRAALLADLAVDLGHRTLHPALTLVRRTREVPSGVSDYQYGFPDKNAAALFARVGYHRLGHMTRYARVLRTRPYLERLECRDC
jgi:hypothetical protein